MSSPQDALDKQTKKDNNNSSNANPFTAGTADYYRYQLSQSQKASSQELQNSAEQKVNYEALQKATKDAQDKAITSGQPQTVTKQDIQTARQNILDTKYLVRDVPTTEVLGPNSNKPTVITPGYKEYSIPVIDKKSQDDALRANYSEFQKANLAAQNASLTQDRQANIARQYENFKAQQNQNAAGNATAYGRSPVRYEVNLNDSLSGPKQEENFTRMSKPADFGGKQFEIETASQANARRISESNQNIKRGIVDYGAEIVSFPFEVGAMLGIKQSGDIAKGIKQAAGVDESKPVVSPSGLAFSEIGLGIATAVGDTERQKNLSAQVEAQKQGISERPGEFLTTSLIDLAPVGGFKGALKNPIKLQRAFAETTDVTLEGKAAAIPKEVIVPKAPQFERVSLDLGTGAAKQVETRPFESTTVDLGKGAVKTPEVRTVKFEQVISKPQVEKPAQAFVNTTVDLGQGNTLLGPLSAASKPKTSSFKGLTSKPRRTRETDDSSAPTGTTTDNGSSGTVTVLEAPATETTTVEAATVAPQDASISAGSVESGGEISGGSVASPQTNQQIHIEKVNPSQSVKIKPAEFGKVSPQKPKETIEDQARKQVGETLGFKQQEQVKLQNQTKPVQKPITAGVTLSSVTTRPAITQKPQQNLRIEPIRPARTTPTFKQEQARIQRVETTKPAKVETKNPFEFANIPKFKPGQPRPTKIVIPKPRFVPKERVVPSPLPKPNLGALGRRVKAKKAEFTGIKDLSVANIAFPSLSIDTGKGDQALGARRLLNERKNKSKKGGSKKKKGLLDF